MDAACPLLLLVLVLLDADPDADDVDETWVAETPAVSWSFAHSAPPSDRTRGSKSVQPKEEEKPKKRTMSIQRIHTRKLLATPFTVERTIIRMELLVAFTIVLPCKAFSAPRPVTLEWFFFIM